MDDFSAELTAHLNAMLAENVEPVFLVVDLWGVDQIKAIQGQDGVEKFRESAMNWLTNTCGGDAFAYGLQRIVGILPAPSRLKTFAYIQKLQRALPLLAQSFNCILTPEFDVLEYDPEAGVTGLMRELTRLPSRRDSVA